MLLWTEGPTERGVGECSYMHIKFQESHFNKHSRVLGRFLLDRSLQVKRTIEELTTSQK